MRNTLQQVCKKYELTSILERIPEKSDEIIVKVGFLGEFNSGKSTLINGLIGEKILPALDIPTTKNYTAIIKGESDHTRFFKLLEDSTREEIEQLEFNDIAKGRKDGIVVVEVPNAKFIPNNLQIIDTPGVDSLDASDKDITFGLLPQIDAAIICLDVNKGGITNTFIDFVKKTEIQALKDKILIVITKKDSKESGIDEIKNKTIEGLKQYLGIQDAENRVIAVSGTAMLNGDNDDKQQLVSLFNREIISRKQDMENIRFNKLLLGFRDEIVEQLKFIRDNASVDSSEIDKDIKAIEKEIEELDATKKAFDTKLKDFEDHLNHKLGNLRNSYVEIITSSLPSVGDVTTDSYENTALEFIQALNNEIELTTQHFFNDLEVNIHTVSISSSNSLINSIKKITKTKDVAVTIVTSAALAVVTGGAGAIANSLETAGGAVAKSAGSQAAKSVGKVAAKEMAKKSAALILLGEVSKVIDQVNPLEHIGTFISNSVASGHVDSFVRTTINNAISESVYNMDFIVNSQVIDPTRNELNGKYDALETVRKMKHDKNRDLSAYKNEIGENIQKLNKLI
jgi:GTPase SAR1 family protein